MKYTTLFLVITTIFISACKKDVELAEPLTYDSKIPEFYINDNNKVEPEIVQILGFNEYVLSPRDIDVNPETGDVWLMNKGSGGSDVLIIKNLGKESQSVLRKEDSHAGHFMINGTAISFSNIGTFGTTQEILNTDGNPQSTFMGPALWPSDLSVFANIYQSNWDPTKPLGSHYDMLHQSPYSMGIEHHDKNAFWVFDGFNGNLCYYDFVDDHGPGADDHSDGIVRRYIEVQLQRTENVPGHMVLDKENGFLYICNTGKGTVLKVDIKTGQKTNAIQQINEPLAEYVQVENVDYKVFASGLDKPSGIELSNGRIFVTDFSTGDIIVYDAETGDEMDRLVTGIQGLTGLKKIGNRLYCVNYYGSQFLKIEPRR